MSCCESSASPTPEVVAAVTPISTSAAAAAASSSPSYPLACHASERTCNLTSSDVIILGSGSSTGVPRVVCLTDPDRKCETCILATQLPAETNRNWRNNPSLLIRFVHHPEQNSSADSSAGADSASSTSPPSSSSKVSIIQIDIGKTFLSAAQRWYPYYGVRSLDSVLITHDHADAILGLDDLRSIQHFEQDAQGRIIMPPALKINVSQHTHTALKQKFAYLFPQEIAPTVERRVAFLEFPIRRPFCPFQLHGLDVLPLPLIHGEDYCCNGYVIGTGLGQQSSEGKECCVYLSDVSRIPKVTMEYLFYGKIPKRSEEEKPTSSAVTTQESSNSTSLESTFSTLSLSDDEWYERFNQPSTHALPVGETWAVLPPSTPQSPDFDGGAPRISLLVLDAIFPVHEHNTHINLPQALQLIERLQPKKALLVGLSDLFEFGRDNAMLIKMKEEGKLTVSVELAYDGKRVPLDL